MMCNIAILLDSFNKKANQISIQMRIPVHMWHLLPPPRSLCALIMYTYNVRVFLFNVICKI